MNDQYRLELRHQTDSLSTGAPELEHGEFPLEAFPPILADYSQTLSETYGVPRPLFLLVMLGAVAGATGKGWKLTEAVPGFSNFANIYLLLGLETGSYKSLAGRIVSPIAEKEKRRLDDWETNELPVLKAKLRKAQNEEKAQKDPFALDQLAKEIAKFEKSIKRNPALMLGSCTTAALAQNIQNMDHEIAMLYSPEGGDLLRVALGMYRDNGIDADLLLSGFTGESYGQSRAGSGTIRLGAPLISLLGMVQPTLIREALNNDEAKQRGLLGRLLAVPLEHPVPLDDGIVREVSSCAEDKWCQLLKTVLDERVENNSAPLIVKAESDARDVFLRAHNQAAEWINGTHQDLRPWLVRYREQACRVALCLQIATDPKSTVLTADNARRAVSLVRWCFGQLAEMLHEKRTEALRARIEKLNSMVLGPEVATMRDLKRAGFTEAEVRQLCKLECENLEIYEHRPSAGGRPSLQVRVRTLTQK